MNVYSNSFFHRTRIYDSIKNILEDGFKAFYCLEEFITNKGFDSIAIPMISFSDIPLAYIRNGRYGKNGLLMKRSWGTNKKLVPVWYYSNNTEAPSTKIIMNAGESFKKGNDVKTFSILGFSKPVRKINNEEEKNKDNYVEREWRKVYANVTKTQWMNSEKYKEYRGPKDTPKKPIKDISLKFTIDDIDFIVIEKKYFNDLVDFIMKNLKYIGGNKTELSAANQYKLLTKIVKYEDLAHNI